MGAVYEGFDARLVRRVAIKILPKETGTDHEVLARFEREAKAMAALDHPNIVHIHDYGQTPDGNPYFVMEFIDGMDVHKLRYSGLLDLPGALDLVSQVCSALQYAHSRGIVHRDIKPGNILVNREGVAKVADFGLAKVLGSDTQTHHEPALTKSGTAMGTPDYMAPEQLEGGPIDHRADIYSLGVMIYDLLTGSPPRGAWPPPSQRVQIDIRLDEIVLRALQQNPSSRYQAASEVRADIDSVKFSTGGGPLPPGVDPTPLPSSISSSPSIHAAPSTGGAVRGKKSPTTARPAPADEIADTSGGLATTMLILGLLAIAITGGLAFYLANQKPGTTQVIEHQTSKSETNTTTFVREIPPGMNAKDLEGVGNIHSYDNGFIGISMEAFDWEQAKQLAKRTGAEVLSVDESDPAWEPLHEWLKTTFAINLSTGVWARNQNDLRILDSTNILVPESPDKLSPDLRHKVLLHWLPAKPVSTGLPIKSTPLLDPSATEEPAIPTPPETLVEKVMPVPDIKPAPPAGPVPWTNTDGKTINAEYVRLNGDTVVIRKDGKEYKIPLIKLSSASREQALTLGGKPFPAPR
jgi:serine/threonine protein kinase